MTRPKEPSGPEVLRLFYYIMGEDHAVARAGIRRRTSDITVQSTEAIARSRALLERLRVAERDAQAHWVGHLMEDGPEAS
jgi:hypothetical protein